MIKIILVVKKRFVLIFLQESLFTKLFKIKFFKKNLFCLEFVFLIEFTLEGYLNIYKLIIKKNLLYDLCIKSNKSNNF